MRTVVVTGSASGIGQALSQLLTARGDRVIGVDIHDADVIADLSTPEGRASLVTDVTAASGGAIDAIVANAGLARYSTGDVAVNYFGAVATIEGLRPLLAGSDAPRIAITSSLASIMPADERLIELQLAGDEAAALARTEVLMGTDAVTTIYSSTKVAIGRWMRRVAASAEYAGAGIPINAVAPAIVVTAMTTPMMQTPEETARLDESCPMPLNGHMQPTAPATLLAWLVSPENTHVCGQMIFIDGGSDVVLRGEAAW